MRIVHVSHSDLDGGASLAAYRIHRALLAAGADSVFLCARRFSQDSAVHCWPPPGLAAGVASALRVLLTRGIRLCLGKYYALNLLHTGMAAQVARLKPDVIHLHWVNAETCSLAEIGRLMRGPSVWSLHDLWPCTATEHYPEDDRFKRGYDRGNSRLVERWAWRRKRRQWQGAGTWLVGSGAWVAGEARASTLWRGHERVETIACPVDLECFTPRDPRTARLRWQIDPASFVILFGCIGGVWNRQKGFELLAEAAGRLPSEIRGRCRIVLFGEPAGVRQAVHGVPVESLGVLDDPRELAWLYAAADVFAFPSRRETCGQTKLEALACGVPVLAFASTGCAEGLTHRVNGWVCEPFDCGQLAAGLAAFETLKRTDPAGWQTLRTACRASVQSHAASTVARAWQALYGRVLAGVRNPAGPGHTAQTPNAP